MVLPACDGGPGLEAPSSPPPPASSAPAKVFELGPSEPQRHQIEKDEIHVYSLELGAGELLHLQVEQLGSCDVFLDLSGPGGFEWPRIDSAQESASAEPLFARTGDAGEYRLEIGAYAPGAYEVRLDPPRPPTGLDLEQVEAHRSFFEARLLRSEDPPTAARKYREAAGAWQESGDRGREARAWFELTRLRSAGIPDAEKQQAFDRACSLFEELGDARQGASCHHLSGGLRARLGDLAAARDEYARSLRDWRQLGRLEDVSIVAYDLADVERRLGRPVRARELLHEALEIARRSGDLLHEAKVRTLLGALYHYRGQTAQGVREYRAALQALARLPQDRDVKKEVARTSTRLAGTLPFADGFSADEIHEARELLDRALALRRELGDRPGLASTLTGLGLLYETTNRPRDALDAYREAEEIYGELGSATSVAVVYANRCRVLERLDRLAEARECYSKALSALRVEGYQNAEAQVLHGLARVDRRRGELHQAQRWIREALEVVDLVRRESEREDLRLSYLDRKYDYYETAIDLGLELHEREPEAGHAAAAFHTLESARARGLLEALVGETLDRPRTASPRLAFVEPPILAAEAARRLLDPDTVLLEYHLGETRSAVWAILDDEVVFRPLPPRAVIEEVARDLHEALRGGAHEIRTWNVDRLAAELSRLVLAPVADLLDRPQLVVVPAGALLYVPFAALPHPAGLSAAGPPQPLLLSHRVSSAPSASVLAAMRGLYAERTPPPGLLAILASPVLRSDDARLAGRARSGDLADLPFDELAEPLPGAAAEARAILGLVDGDAVLPALGFDASRETVFSGALGDYRVLHFATHGRLDDTRGELSALALSRFDADGRRVDGYLWAYELYQLDLRADLVVLSACQTALGREIRGEGLIGLTRGFLYAGAERVVVSLWKVDDEATARLMELFYDGYLRRKLPPAEALRQAQLELRRQGWQAPYYWAPFVVQGDWREADAAATEAAGAAKPPFP
jgi:CHAT domain-containing protein